jgi:microcin C transport system substrate-binding protein
MALVQSPAIARYDNPPRRRVVARLWSLPLAAFFLLFALLPVTAGEVAGGTVSHGIAIHGDVKYPADFSHFDYVDPEAPKGGEVQLHSIGTFDSLNALILKGVPAVGLSFLLFDTLTTQSYDEPASEYGLLAESIEVPDDRSWVIFTLRGEARFHDGTPVTVEDVVFSFNLLVEKGAPFWRAYYASVASVEALDERRVKFTFSEGMNRELPVIVGQFPILSKAYYTEQDFTKVSLDPPLGSGPYRVERVDAGRSITYRRDPDYWGKDLPVNRGRYNFDRFQFDYYRDTTVALEAFKAHEYDQRQENSSKFWATLYEGPLFDEGLIVKEEIPNEIPTGMQGFFMNTRNPIFRDRRVREAIGYAFDFEWTNKTLFYGAYTRTKSYFANSELAAAGLPSPAELELLEPYRGEIPDEAFTREYQPPMTDGSGNARANLRQASELLREAGWTVEEGRRVDPETGEPMVIEFLLYRGDPQFERIIGAFRQNLEKLGIEVKLYPVDTAQYQKRVEDFDFDIITATIRQSPSPGNEQRDFWSSIAADIPGSRNMIGIKDPVVDALIEKIIAASDREALIAACRALDRVLLWNHYVVPQWHIRHFRVAYWNRFARPEIRPKYRLGFIDTWWLDSAKEAALEGHESLLEAE